MADIVTNTLQIGNDKLILRDADAQEQITSLKEDLTQVIDSAYVTDTASGAIASFPDGADGVPVKSLKVNIEPVQSGSGDPSPDNVRPISGYTQAVVTRTGKNLLDTFGRTFSTSSETANTIRTESSTATFQGDSIVTVINGAWSKLRFRVDGLIKGKTYTLSAFIENPSKNDVGVAVFNGKSWVRENIAQFDGTTVPLTFTYDDSFSVLVAAIVLNNKGSVTDATVTVSNVQLELGSTVTTYEPYAGNTYTIDLNGNIYGGTLDVTTGVLTADTRLLTVNDFPYYSTGISAGGLHWVDSAKSLPISNGAGGICSHAQFKPNGWTDSVPTFSFNSNGFPVRVYVASESLEAFKAEYASMQLAYRSAEYFTVQLTPQEITTLLGQNNIWSDTGDVEVEYRADTKRYIEKLTAPTEDDMIADHAISSGSFFMVGNTLYRATTAIASGATITVGTNATKLSLSDALNALS